MVIRGLLKKKKTIISYAFCHSTEKNNHRGKSCWTRLRRSWRPGCQEKLGNLVRLRWSLSKWPWHSFFSSSLKCGLDGFTRDLPNTSSCPHVFILWNWRYGLKAKFLPQAACFLSIFAFSTCHKITVIIFFFPKWTRNDHAPCSWRGIPEKGCSPRAFACSCSMPGEGMASVEPAPGGARLGGRKADPVEAEGQWAGWHSQLLQAKLSVCRNELCSTGLEQIERLFKCLFKPLWLLSFYSIYKVFSESDWC